MKNEDLYTAILGNTKEIEKILHDITLIKESLATLQDEVTETKESLDFLNNEEF